MQSLSLCVRVCVCVLCVIDTKVILYHPVSVAIVMAQQNRSVKCCGYICCYCRGVWAAVEKTEEAEQEQTGIFSHHVLCQETLRTPNDMFIFDCTENKMSLREFKLVIK